MIVKSICLMLCAVCVAQNGSLAVEDGQAVERSVLPLPPFNAHQVPTGTSVGPATQERAQQTRPNLPQQQPSEEDIVFFAADSVEFQLPYGWNVQETPWERDIFLQMGPAQRFSRDPRELSGGVWIRYRPTRDSTSEADLGSELQLRMQAAVATMPQVGEPRAYQVGGYPGLLQEFLLPSPDGQVTPSAHFVVLTPWGTFELRATEADPNSQFVSAATARLIQSLKFHPPAPGIGAGKPVAQKAAAATSIFGTWKAMNGRMQILHDGRVALEFDRKQVIRFDESGAPTFREPHVVLIGRYTAEKDVLQVTWEDGSQTNYRWQVQGEDLLLTDHRGRVSQLSPVFE